MIRLFAAFVVTFVGVPAAAQDVAQAPSGSQIVASADSPSRVLHVDVTLNPEGRVGYMVSRLGKPVIAESRLGFLFTDAPEMLRNFEFAGRSTTQLRRDLGRAVGRVSDDPQPLQRADRQLRRDRMAEAADDCRLPRLR